LGETYFYKEPKLYFTDPASPVLGSLQRREMASFLSAAPSKHGTSLLASTSSQFITAQKAQDVGRMPWWMQEPDVWTVLASVSASFLATGMLHVITSLIWEGQSI